MDNIQILFKQNPYKPLHDWTVAVDGLALDEWVADRAEGHFRGLVPALGNLSDPEESALAWQKMLPLPGRSTLAPVLICPQHLNLNCAVIMAEILRLPGEIIWRRFGLSNGDSPCAESPEDIQWLPECEGLSFELTAYLACLERFKLIEIDREQGLDGKRLVLLLGLYWSRDPRTVSGTLRLRPDGLFFEHESSEPIPIGFRWLQLFRPVAPDSGALLADADYYLSLENLWQLDSAISDKQA